MPERTSTLPEAAGEPAAPDWAQDPLVRRARYALPLGVHAVSAARHFVARTAPAWDVAPEQVAAATLLVSELVTNAVLYGYGAVSVQLRCGRGLLRVEVTDGSPGLPHPRARVDDDEAGLGFLVIAAYSQAWGVQPQADGKLVWCDIALGPAA